MQAAPTSNTHHASQTPRTGFCDPNLSRAASFAAYIPDSQLWPTPRTHYQLQSTVEASDQAINTDFLGDLTVSRRGTLRHVSEEGSSDPWDPIAAAEPVDTPAHFYVSHGFRHPAELHARLRSRSNLSGRTSFFDSAYGTGQALPQYDTQSSCSVPLTVEEQQQQQQQNMYCVSLAPGSMDTEGSFLGLSIPTMDTQAHASTIATGLDTIVDPNLICDVEGCGYIAKTASDYR